MFIFASYFYHDFFWYPLKGKRILNKWLARTGWGELYREYADLQEQLTGERVAWMK